jgi:poly(hydroxyalkanoate) granule-associated protein
MTNVEKMEKLAKDMSDELMDTGRQVWLAGLGAFGMAGNTAQAVFEMVVEEGLKLQKIERKRIDSVVDDVTDRVDRIVGEFGDRFAEVNKLVDKTVEATTRAALTRLGLPTRKDVTDLMVRVDQLTAKVENLKASKRRMAYAR